MQVSFCSPQHVASAWKLIKRDMERVTSRTGGRRTPAGALDDLLNDRASLWMAHDEDRVYGFATTRLMPYDGVKILQVELLAGSEFDRWIDVMHQTLETFARENGCVGMELIGRKGWTRKLKNYGWKEKFVTCELRWD